MHLASVVLVGPFFSALQFFVLMSGIILSGNFFYNFHLFFFSVPFVMFINFLLYCWHLLFVIWAKILILKFKFNKIRILNHNNQEFPILWRRKYVRLWRRRYVRLWRRRYVFEEEGVSPNWKWIFKAWWKIL